MSFGSSGACVVFKLPVVNQHVTRQAKGSRGLAIRDRPAVFSSVGTSFRVSNECVSYDPVDLRKLVNAGGCQKYALVGWPGGLAEVRPDLATNGA